MKPVIIGAGPVGSYTARLLKELNPIVVENKKEVGVPVQCTGLVSTRLQEISGYPDKLILNKVRGAKLYSKNEESVINARRVMAHIIDRVGFDKWMHAQCKAETRFSERFINYHKGLVKTSRNLFECDLVINCSGPKNGLLGVQAVAKLERDSDFVELHFNECPDFFAWVVPTGDGYCRIGLASDMNNNPMGRLKKFLKKINAGKVKEWNGGLIPMRVNEFINNNYLRCGDAAGQVKAVSGGGLVTGLLSSEVMSKAILKACKEGNYSKRFFKKHYYKPWSNSVGKELRLHAKARRFLNKVDYDKLLRFINNNKELIEQYGDMDFLSKFVFKLLKLRNIGFLLKSGAKFIFS